MKNMKRLLALLLTLALGIGLAMPALAEGPDLTEQTSQSTALDDFLGSIFGIIVENTFFGEVLKTVIEFHIRDIDPAEDTLGLARAILIGLGLPYFIFVAIIVYPFLRWF